MIKLLGFLIVTVLCIVFALIPEIAMYFTWGLIDPQSEITKLFLVLVFWVCGGGMCVLFGLLGFMFWTAIVSEIL